nr:glycosyltransferase family 4 protein [Microbacterium thalassium]
MRLPRKINPFDPHLGPLSIQARSQAIDRVLAREVRRPEITTVYAYEDSAADAFAAARSQGVRTLYDLPIGYWRTGRAIFAEEAERRPEWRGTLTGLRDPEWKLERKDRELAGADELIVASSFTARTLADYPGQVGSVSVIPYGTPARAQEELVAGEGAIRVLFVGGLSQRKGIADLFDAIPLVDASVELTVVGRRVGECAPRDRMLDRVTWHESLPHARILELIAAHDVLVLPSLFEGFGLVLTEALSQGTPIIATDHTAAPDLLAGVEDAGWIVPIRSPEAIGARITDLNDPAFRAHSREQALSAAALRSWEAYRRQIVAVVEGGDEG